jgi:hypothetical protein
MITLDAIIGPMRHADGMGLLCRNESTSIDRR